MLNVLLFFLTYAGGITQGFRIAPIFLLVTYQAIYFFNPPGRWWFSLVPNLSYSFYTVALMGVLYLMNKKSLDDRSNFFGSVPMRCLVILVSLYYLASFYAVSPITHSVYLEAYWKMALTMFFAFKFINSIKFLDYSIIAYVYGAWYLSFVAYQTGRNSGNRVEGIGTVDTPDSNGVASALVPAMVFSVYYIWVCKGWRKLPFLIAAAFIANALVLINSRGAFLGAFVGLLIFMGHLFFTSVKQKAQKAKVIAIGMIGLVAAISVMDDSFKERIFSIAEESEVSTEKETGATRTIFWKAAVEMSFDYPFGQGGKGFNYHAPDYIPADVVINSTGDMSRAARKKTVHSTWFEVLTEVGYPGLITFLTMLYYSFKYTSRAKEKLRKIGKRVTEHYYKILAIECALISFMVSMSFINRMRAEVLQWCILFCACSYKLYVLRKNEHINSDS
ncbi:MULTISPECIES: O-antigen ligase family protein [unclassified Alteromonas]|uniref:O-antigen ligase family protein n=1 Tax=unclassified Alteromonas TaxID=2614992 RepID=UPI0005099B84|nr:MULTISPECIES: O-antigen ligase family protein [unclassified Alteromonas]